MKTTKRCDICHWSFVICHWSLVMVLAMLTSIAQASTPSYLNTYKPDYQQQAVGRVQRTEYRIQTTATAPTVGFQSTSAYSGQWNQDAQQSMLNTDGTVNAEAYGVGTYRPGMRKATKEDEDIPNPPDPEEEGDEGNVPIGDGLLVLLALAMGYAVAQFIRAHRITRG